MDSLARTLLSSFLYVLVVLGVLQFVPPLLRVYLRRSGSKRLKLFLYGLAFGALYFRIVARQKVLTDEGIVLSGSLRTNPLVKQVYLLGCYEPTLAAYLKRKVTSGDVFLDIGANSGHFSLIAAKLGSEGAFYLRAVYTKMDEGDLKPLLDRVVADFVERHRCAGEVGLGKIAFPEAEIFGLGVYRDSR